MQCQSGIRSTAGDHEIPNIITLADTLLSNISKLSELSDLPPI